MIVERYGAAGGAQEVAVVQAAELLRRGLDVELVFLSPGQMVDRAKALGLRVTVVATRFRAGPTAFVETCIRLAGLIGRKRPTVVLGNGTSLRLLAGMPSKLLRTRFVWQVFDGQRARGLRRTVFVFLQSLISPDVTMLMSEEAEATVPALPGRLGVTWRLRPPIDLEGLRTHVEPGARRAMGIPEDAPLVTMFARVTPHKGHLDLVEAFARVAPSDAFLVLGGPFDPADPYYRELLSAIAEVGIEARTLVPGYLDAAVRNGLLASSTILVHPAHWEPYGLTLVEAAALGTAVIAADAQGPAATVRDLGGGVLYPRGDVAALSHELGRLLGDAGARWQLAECAAARVRNCDVRTQVALTIESWLGKAERDGRRWEVVDA